MSSDDREQAEAPILEIPASPSVLPIPLPSFATLLTLQPLHLDVFPIIDTAPHSIDRSSHLLARCQLLAASKRRRLDDILISSSESSSRPMNWWKSELPSATFNVRGGANEGTDEEREGLLGGAQRTMLVRPKPMRGIAFSPYHRQPTPEATERSSILSFLELVVEDSSQLSPTSGDPTPEGTPFPTSSITIGNYWTRNNTVDEPLSTMFCAGSFEWVTQFDLALYRITIPLSSIASLAFTTTSLTLTLASPPIYRIKSDFASSTSQWTPSQSVSPISVLNEVHVLALEDAPTTMRSLRHISLRYPNLLTLLDRSLSSFQRPPLTSPTALRSPLPSRPKISNSLSAYRFPPSPSLPPTPPLSPTASLFSNDSTTPYVNYNPYFHTLALESPPLSLRRDEREGERERLMGRTEERCGEEDEGLGTESSHGGMDCRWLSY